MYPSGKFSSMWRNLLNRNVGFLINERFINIPAQVENASHDALLLIASTALADEEEKKDESIETVIGIDLETTFSW